MTDDQQTASELWARILAGLFDGIEMQDAVALVGILFDYRIVLSEKFRRLFRQTPTFLALEPLLPQEASIFVANLFHMDCDMLFKHFVEKWSELRDSPRTAVLKATIQTHEFVDRLELWSSVP